MTHKVLIIEDDQMINEMYSMKFQNEGFEVQSAYNGLDGLTKVSNYHPDIILLDLMMPSMNGFETLEAIKHNSSLGSKIIIFTNVADKEKMQQAMAMGADDYLIKANTTPKEVLERVNTYIQDTPPTAPIYVKPGINHFKMKNPNGGKDINIEINVNV